MPGDHELVRQALAGRPDAAELLIRRHDAELRRLARSRIWRRDAVGPSLDVDDVMQDFYEKICRHRFRVLAQWNGLTDLTVVSIQPYFARILGNVIIDRAREDLRRPRVAHSPDTDELPDEPADPGAGPEELVDDGQVRAAVRRCINSALNERQRQVVNLYLEGLSHEQIAQRLGITQENSRVLLHRAFDALQNCVRQGRA